MLFIWHRREPSIEGTEEALSGEWGEPRVYKNTKRLPPRAATYDEIVALMTISS